MRIRLTAVIERSLHRVDQVAFVYRESGVVISGKRHLDDAFFDPVKIYNLRRIGFRRRRAVLFVLGYRHFVILIRKRIFDRCLQGHRVNQRRSVGSVVEFGI